jgi:hypothetical protein
MMAKEILEERREIALPEPAIPTKLYTIEKVDLERRLGDVIPDVTVYIEGQPILIEIIVTHGIDQKKSKAIRELDISTLIIDLSGETRSISKGDLASIVVEDIDKKRWEYNRYTAELVKRRVKASRRMNVTKRRSALGPGPLSSFSVPYFFVEGCPIRAREYRGKPYADVQRDCWDCEFLVEDGVKDKEYEASNPDLSYEARERLLYDPGPHEYILCDGHATIRKVGLAEWKAQRDAASAEHTAMVERLWYGGKFGGTWERQKGSSERLKRRMDI